MNEIVTTNYEGFSLSFTAEGWFKATTSTEKFGKRPNDWLSLDSTKEYIAALSALLKCDPKSLSKTKRGGNTKGTVTGNSGNGQGTWFHPKLGVPFARWLDISFGVWCDDQIYKILTGKHPHYDWKKLRSEAASSFKVMSAVLQLQRQNIGKATAHHHYQNEAKLVNWALIGKFESIDREALSAGDLELLAKLEERNTVLIGVGLDREDRQRALEKFVTDWRIAHTPQLESVA